MLPALPFALLSSLLMSPAWTLEVQENPDCAELGQLEARVMTLLEHSTLEDPLPHIRVSHASLEEASRLVLEIEREGELQRHQLDGPSCESLMPATALLIAVTLDPLVLNRPQRPAPAVQSPAVPPREELASEPEAFLKRGEDSAESDASATTASEVAFRPAHRHGRTAMKVRSGFGSGITPALNFGIGAAVDHLVHPRWSVAFGLRHSFERVTSIAGGNGGIGVAASFTTSRACWRGVPGQIELLICAGADLGIMIGRANDVPDPGSLVVAWGTAVAGAGFRWPRRARVALALDVEGWVPFARTTFKFPGVSGVYRPDPAGVYAMLGMDLRFGSASTQKNR